MPTRQLATIKKSTIVRSFKLLEQVAPAAGARWAEVLWFAVPRAGGGRDRQAPPGHPFQVQVDGRTVAGERWGDGPAVYLVHGWGGWRWQLDAFAGPLAGAGFKVVTFDAPSHGDSDPGRAGPGRSNILEFAAALTAVAAVHGPAHAVVAHSLGATSAAFALRHGLTADRLVFLSPMADPLPYTRTLAARLGFGERIRTRLVRRIERRIGMPMSAFAMPGMAGQVPTPPVLLVHDRLDAETAVTDSEAIARSWPASRLVITSGLGHRRILRDPEVVAEVAGFVSGPVAAGGGAGRHAARAWPAAGS